MDKKIIKIEDLGFNDLFKTENPNFNDYSPARVISEVKGAYIVKDTEGDFFAKVTGKHIFEAKNREDYPAVGDWVMIDKSDNEHAVIKSILPRQSIIKRRFGDKNKIGEKKSTQVIATNIDVGFIIESIDRDYSLNRFERYFSILKEGGVKPVIILNKTDLLSNEEKISRLKELKERFPDTDIIFTNIVNVDGSKELENYIKKGKTYCFLGSSGVGKSSLINKLIGREIIKTGDISSCSDRGKHTTTSRQMYFLENGGIVIDNPGVREVGILNTEKEIEDIFIKFNSFKNKCKYSNCTHTHEPGCVILEAKQVGEIKEDEYINYINLKKEAEYCNMNDSQKRQKNKAFGKFIKKAKKELGIFGYEDY